MEFTNEQLQRIDEVDNAVFEMCKVLTENENLEWDMAFIGEIADLAADILVENGHKVRYPYHIVYDDGREEIVDYHEQL